MKPRNRWLTTREQLKENTGREEFKNLITQGWRRTEKNWTKKRELGLLILISWSNNTQLLTNCRASIKRFILFNLFIPESKSINFVFFSQFTLTSKLLLLVFD